MSQAASQASAFYREVATTRVVWTVRDKDGFPAPITSSGKRAQPFWSSRSRAERIIKSVPGYSGFEPFEVSWDEFCKKWVPSLSKDGILIGVNWSGKYARGYDLEPEQLVKYVRTAIENPEL